MGYNTSTNMLLPIPQVGNEAGPQYATDVNNCLTIVDSHDHSPGYGVQITPNGININQDFDQNSNNIIGIRSSRYSAQGAVLSLPSDLRCLYVVSNDLYYNDGLGNNVRLTQNGSVAGTSGSIANLVPPASASYSSSLQTFIWQSNTLTAAFMDSAAITIRHNSSGSAGVTLNPPASLPSDYDLYLPSVPVANSVMALNTSGVMYNATPDSTLSLTGSALSVADQGITQIKLAPRPTGTSVAAGGVAVSTAISATINPLGNSDVGSITITTTGRPVYITCTQNGGQGSFQLSSAAGVAQVQFLRGVSPVMSASAIFRIQGAAAIPTYPPGIINAFDFPAAGTYTYTMNVQTDSLATFEIANLSIVAYEL